MYCKNCKFNIDNKCQKIFIDYDGYEITDGDYNSTNLQVVDDFGCVKFVKK